MIGDTLLLQVAAVTDIAPGLRHLRLLAADGGKLPPAAAGAHVKHPRCRSGVGHKEWQANQRPVDQGLCVWPRVQHMRIHLQIKPIKGFAAGDVGHRLSGQTPLQHARVKLDQRGRQRILVVCNQPGALMPRPAKRMQ